MNVGLPTHRGMAGGDLFHVCPEAFMNGSIGFKEHTRLRAAAEGFETHRSDTTEDVSDSCTFHERAESIENNLTHAIRVGSRGQSVRRGKFSTTKVTADDPQAHSSSFRRLPNSAGANAASPAITPPLLPGVLLAF